MRRNTSLLADQVRDKLTNKCVTAIVTEAFINALPFDKVELATEASKLSEYAVSVIDKMHPENILNRAMEATIDNDKAHLYVQNLKSAIDEVVEGATRRVVQESLTLDNPTPEIVAQTKLNSEETEKLIAASKKSGTDAVAKLVKDKMIDVIKDEKNAYETEGKLRREVKEIIKQENENLKSSMEDSEKSETLESYFDMILSPTDSRSHISVFSKMQDMCMEAILHSNEIYDGEIPYKTLEKITLESTFPYFDLSNKSLIDELNDMLIVTESALDADHEGELIEQKKKSTAKTAFICTICIMTLLETLKTMHLAKPSMNDVKNFVDDVTNVKKIANTNLGKIEDKVNSVVADSKKSIALGAYNAIELSQAKESLEKAKNMIDKLIVTESENARKDRILSKINTALEAIVAGAPEEGDKTITSSFITRLKEENLANLEHGVKIIAQKPMVNQIQINLRSDMKCDENSNVDIEVKGTDSNGSCVAIYMIKIHAIPDFGTTVAEVIRDCANYCDFGTKPVKMYFTDSGYSVPLKG